MKIEREPCKPTTMSDGGYSICVVGKVGDLSTAQTVNYKNDGPEGNLTTENVEAIATRLMAAKPLISAAVNEKRDAAGKVIVKAQAELRGLSKDEKMAAWFRKVEAIKRLTSPEVSLPQVEETYEGEETYTDDDGDEQTRPVEKTRMVDSAKLPDLTVPD